MVSARSGIADRARPADRRPPSPDGPTGARTSRISVEEAASSPRVARRGRGRGARRGGVDPHRRQRRRGAALEVVRRADRGGAPRVARADPPARRRGAARAHAPDPAGAEGRAVRHPAHAPAVAPDAGRAVRPRVARPRARVAAARADPGHQRLDGAVLAGAAAVRVRRDGAGRRVEVFCFGTRLTRVTRTLRTKDPDRAMHEIGRPVADWEGGTRIGESLKALLDGWSQRAALRGAVVVLCSDGLERGDPELLRAQMARLRRLAHRVVWVNPLKGSPRYEPLARGMAAALPSDRRVPAGPQPREPRGALARARRLASRSNRVTPRSAPDEPGAWAGDRGRGRLAPHVRGPLPVPELLSLQRLRSDPPVHDELRSSSSIRPTSSGSSS